MFSKIAAAPFALLLLTAGYASAQFGPAIGPPVGPVPSGPSAFPPLTIPPAPPGWRTPAPSPTVAPAAMPDISGVWKARLYKVTYSVQGSGGAYSVTGSDGSAGTIVRQGQNIVAKFSLGNGRWTAISAVSGLKANEIDWAFPPPDGTSWDAWLR